MPAIPQEDLLPRFEAEFQRLAGNAHRAASPDSLHQILHSILESNMQKRIVLSLNPILGLLGLPDLLARAGLAVGVWTRDVERANEVSYREACFEADAGITGVEFALVESGSLVLTSQTEGSQLSSLAPPVHIALYRRSQLRASLDEVLEALPVAGDLGRPSPGRSVVFVTGPSRTADIEQILIHGVHGPREVHAILVEDACFTSQRPA